MKHERTRTTGRSSSGAGMFAEVSVIAAALHSPPAGHTDLHLGSGVVFTLGPQGQTTLELYAHTTRVGMGDRQLIVPRLPAQSNAGGVVFEDAHGHLALDAYGEVLFHYVPALAGSEGPTRSVFTGHQTLQDLSPSARQDQPPEPTERDVSDDSGATQQPSSEVSPPPVTSSERESGKRILKGRVIATPTFHANPKTGALIGEFRVAVGSQDDPDHTEFVKVSCFDNPAKDGVAATRLQATVDDGSLTPGTRVTVVGFEHPLIRRGKHEGTQVYATVVKVVPEDHPR